MILFRPSNVSKCNKLAGKIDEIFLQAYKSSLSYEDQYYLVMEDCLKAMLSAAADFLFPTQARKIICDPEILTYAYPPLDA